MYNDVLDFEWPDDGLNPDVQANSAENNSAPLDVAPYINQFNRTMTTTIRDLLSTVTSNPGIATEDSDSIVPKIPDGNDKTILATLNNTMSTGISNSFPHFSTDVAETGSLFDTVTQRNILENARTTVTDILSTTDIVGNLTNNVSETLFSENNIYKSNTPNKTNITSELDILTTESSSGETTTFENVLNNVTESIHDIISTTSENHLNESTDSNRTALITDQTLNESPTTLKDIVENFTTDISQTFFFTATEPTTSMSNDSNGTFLTNSATNMTIEATTFIGNVTETIVETVTRDTSTTTRMLSTTGNVNSASVSTTTTDIISTVVDNFTHGISDSTEATISSKPNNSTFLSTNRPDVSTILTRITTSTNKLGASHNYDSIETAQDILMYIIIGVLLLFLIIVFIGLYLYYRKQRKGSLLSGTYYVTELHDTSSSNNKSNNSITEKKEDSGV